MRQICFRLSAGLIAVVFLWALAVGAMADMPLIKRVLVSGMMLVFVICSIAGDRAADKVLGLMFGFPSTNSATTNAPTASEPKTNQADNNQIVLEDDSPDDSSSAAEN